MERCKRCGRVVVKTVDEELAHQPDACFYLHNYEGDCAFERLKLCEKALRKILRLSGHEASTAAEVRKLARQALYPTGKKA